MSFLHRLKSSWRHLLFGTPLPVDDISTRLEVIEKTLHQVQVLLSQAELGKHTPASIPSAHSENQADSISFLGIKEIIGAAVSLSAFAAALFYFAGRAFMIYFFQEMNIPYHQFNFSVREYGEVGWTFVAQYLLRLAMYCLLGATVVGFVSLGANFLWIWVSNRLSRLGESIQKRLPPLQLSGLSSVILKRVVDVVQVSLWAIIGLTLIILVISSASQDASIRGAQAGRHAILNSQHLTLIANHPLDIPGGTTIEVSSNQVLYRYENLYVLAYNDNRYFAYRTLGTEICRPEKVFIIESDQVEQVILSMRSANAPTCDY